MGAEQPTPPVYSPASSDLRRKSGVGVSAHAFAFNGGPSPEVMTMTAPNPLADRLLRLLEAPLAAAGFELVDVECVSMGALGATVRLRVDRAVPASEAAGPSGPTGIDMDGVTEATVVANQVLDAADPIEGTYTLEVSSPGLERPLRLPAHFVRMLGREVAVKARPGTAADRRLQGILEQADVESEGGIVVAGHRLAYADIERARTIFSWGPAPKPGRPAKARPKPAPTSTPAGVEGSRDTSRAHHPRRAGVGPTHHASTSHETRWPDQ